MPSLKLPSASISGLRDMSTDDIKSALADVRVPEVRMSDLDPRKVDLSKLDIDLSGISDAVSAAAATAAERNPLRRKRPSRWPFVIAGLVIAAVAVIVVRNAGRLRAQADEVGRKIRERSEADRIEGSLEPIGYDDGAFAGDVAIPVEPDAYADTLPSAEIELPTASEELAESASTRMRSGDELTPDPEYRVPGS